MSTSQLLCIDIESTCWRGHAPEGQTSEIIEVGYCLLDLKTAQKLDQGGVYVKPAQSQVSEFCTQLTGITQWTLEKRGESFEEACAVLRRMSSLSMPWASFGDYDRHMFTNQCLYRGVPYPFSQEHLNIKEMINQCFLPLRQMISPSADKYGLKTASEAFNIPFTGRHHSGADDASNLGSLVLRLASMIEPAKVTG